MTDVHIFIFCVNYVILERVDNAYRKCQYKVHIKKQIESHFEWGNIRPELGNVKKKLRGNLIR